MAKPVIMGAQLSCNQGSAPSVFSVIEPMRPTIENKPAGVITDNVPMANVMSFGMCRSLANPTVAAATSAALGVLTPMPCVPFTVAPWSPGTTNVTISNRPGITDGSSLMCNWAGKIDVSQAGSMNTDVT